MAAVCVSGVVFAELLFKLKNSQGDAEGFLLGRVQRRRVESITDSQSCGSREERNICITSTLCLPEKFSFYDYHGNLNMNRVGVLVGGRQEEMVGWFSYRRGASHRLSLRERAIYWRLRDALGGAVPSDFTLLLLTEQTESGVLTTQHSLHQWTGSSPHAVQLTIVNLLGALSYHTLLPTHLTRSQQHFSTVLKDHRPSLLDTSGDSLQCRAAEDLYRDITARLQPLVSALQESTASVLEVSQRVQRLQREVDLISEGEAESEATNVPTGDAKQVADLVTLDSPQAIEPPQQSLENQESLQVEEPAPTARDSTLEPMSQELF